MAGLSGAEEDSGGLLEGFLAGLLPVERRQLGYVLVGGRGQALQHVFEIGTGFHAVQAAVRKR